MKKLLTLLLVLLVVPAWAADERAKTDRSTRTHTILGVSDTNGEIRQIKTTDTGEIITSPSTGSAPTTVDQGAPATVTTPWPFTISRRSDGVEFGLAASPFATRLFDGAGAALGTTANPWIVGGKDGFGATKTMLTDPDGRVTLLFGVSLGDNLTATGGFRTDTGGNNALHVVSHVWDSTGWDRAPGTAEDGALVNLGTNNDVTVAGVATEAKQDTGNTSLGRLDEGVTNVLSDTTAILAKIIAAPATEAKQDTGNTSLNRLDEGVTNVFQQGGVASVAGISDGAGNILPIQRKFIENTGTAPVTVQEAVGGKRLVVTNVTVIGDGNTTITFRTNGTPITGDLPITKNSGFAPGFDPTGHFQAEVGEALVFITGSNIHVAGWINWVEAP